MRVKVLICVFIFALILQSGMPGSGMSAEKLEIEHPIKSPQKYTDKERCDNCGMDRNKWARTRFEFQSSKGTFHTCSINCLAVMGIKIKEEPKNVKVAEYFHPERMLDAEKAFFVVGSTAPGTMSPISKIAFSSKEDAERHAAKYGGTVADFTGAMNAAKMGVQKSSRDGHKH